MTAKEFILSEYKFNPENIRRVRVIELMNGYSSLQCRERDERIRELEERINHESEFVEKSYNIISELQDKVERYEKALVKYANHSIKCSSQYVGECTCGLDEIKQLLSSNKQG